MSARKEKRQSKARTTFVNRRDLWCDAVEIHSHIQVVAKALGEEKGEEVAVLDTILDMQQKPIDKLDGLKAEPVQS